MIINAEVLNRLMKKTNIDSVIVEAFFDIEEDKVSIKAVTLNQTGFVESYVKKEVISKIDSIGKYAITDLSFLSKVTERFTGDINITIAEDNTVLLKNKKKEVVTKLADIDLLTAIPELNLTYTDKNILKVKTSELKDLLKDTTLLTDSKMGILIFKVVGKTLIVTMEENDNKITTNIPLDKEYDSDIMVKFSIDVFAAPVKLLTAEYVTLKMNTDYPMVIRENFKTHTITEYIIAPRVED